MLTKAGRDASVLECGAHWPSHDLSARTLAASGRRPNALHNNCSGKHAGFVCLACARGIDPAGYAQPDHPVMREVVDALAAMTRTTLDATNRAIDGCSIPTHAIPLRALANAFARFGTGEGLPPVRAAAARRIRAAVAKHPHMVAGSGRFDTRLMTSLGARVFSKTGAEGVFCVAIPELGIGIAIKICDGATRAAEVATATLIERFLPDSPQAPGFAALAHPIMRNWNGIIVGEIRAAGALA
jgi:L-asparaginase II